MGYENAFIEIDKKKNDLAELEEKLKNYSEIISNLGYPEETAGCIKSIENSKNEIELVTQMWKFINKTKDTFEKFKATPEFLNREICIFLSVLFLDNFSSGLNDNFIKEFLICQNYCHINLLYVILFVNKKIEDDI